MVINERPETRGGQPFVIFHIPKTGGTTVRRLYGELAYNNTKDVIDQHETPDAFWKRCPQFREFEFDVVVRNPWRRMESMFRHQFRFHNVWRHQGYTFTRFMEELDVKDSLPYKSRLNNAVMVPQTPYLFLRGEKLFKWPIESIDVWCNFTTDIPVLHASPGPPCIWSKKAFENFEKYYGQDVKNLGHMYEKPDDLLEE